MPLRAPIERLPAGDKGDLGEHAEPRRPPSYDGAAPGPDRRRGQKLIELIVSAIELRKRLIDGAMPVEARKKPKRMATMAGAALIDPPLISTTRMIANRSTTDSEMATTDHTLGRSA